MNLLEHVLCWNKSCLVEMESRQGILFLLLCIFITSVDVLWSLLLINCPIEFLGQISLQLRGKWGPVSDTCLRLQMPWP